MGQQTQTGAARFQRAQRRQITMQMLSLDQMLAEEHTARLVWAYVDALDLTKLYDKIRAVAGGAGRDLIDPQILVSLWSMATIDGIKFRPAAGPALQRTASLPMAVRRGLGESSHARRFSHRPRRISRRLAHAERGDAVASRAGGIDAGRSGRNAGAGIGGRERAGFDDRPGSPQDENGRLVTEWNAFQWALNTVGLLDASDSGDGFLGIKQLMSILLPTVLPAVWLLE